MIRERNKSFIKLFVVHVQMVHAYNIPNQSINAVATDHAITYKSYKALTRWKVFGLAILLYFSAQLKLLNLHKLISSVPSIYLPTAIIHTISLDCICVN